MCANQGLWAHCRVVVSLALCALPRSLGMLMWEMASTQMPWSDMTDAQIVAAVSGHACRLSLSLCTTTRLRHATAVGVAASQRQACSRASF